MSEGLGMYVGRWIKLTKHAKCDNERASSCMIKNIIWALSAKKYSISTLTRFTHIISKPAIAIGLMPAKPA